MVHSNIKNEDEKPEYTNDIMEDALERIDRGIEFEKQYDKYGLENIKDYNIIFILLGISAGFIAGGYFMYWFFKWLYHVIV